FRSKPNRKNQRLRVMTSFLVDIDARLGVDNLRHQGRRGDLVQRGPLLFRRRVEERHKLVPGIPGRLGRLVDLLESVGRYLGTQQRPIRRPAGLEVNLDPGRLDGRAEWPFTITPECDSGDVVTLLIHRSSSWPLLGGPRESRTCIREVSVPREGLYRI